MTDGHSVKVEFALAALILCSTILTPPFNQVNYRLSEESGPYYLMITIDVEALPIRQTEDHVDRLIYGNFTEGRAGIIEMMDAADEAGVKLTFFVDLMEVHLYPGEIEQVIRVIHGREHDVQLHAHPSIIPDEARLEFQTTDEWNESGARWERLVNCWSRGTADFFFKQMLEVFESQGIPRPVAFRGGGYRYNQAVLDSLAAHDINYSYNYNVMSQSASYYAGPLQLFNWSNDMVEVPISYIPSAFGYTRDRYRFDDTYWAPENSAPAVHSFFSEYGNQSVLVMMMHSWALLDTEDDPADGYYNYIYTDDSRTESFQEFLLNIPKDVEVITASELDFLVQAGAIEPTTTHDAAEVSYSCD